MARKAYGKTPPRKTPSLGRKAYLWGKRSLAPTKAQLTAKRDRIKLKQEIKSLRQSNQADKLSKIKNKTELLREKNKLAEIRSKEKIAKMNLKVAKINANTPVQEVVNQAKDKKTRSFLRWLWSNPLIGKTKRGKLGRGILLAGGLYSDKIMDWAAKQHPSVKNFLQRSEGGKIIAKKSGGKIIARKSGGQIIARKNSGTVYRGVGAAKRGYGKVTKYNG